jgi:Entner-Doudoroff aldolase
MPSSDLGALLARTPVVPVLVIEDVSTAVPLARALVAGGLPLLEITLRTAAALDVIRAIGAEVEDAIVGAGTVLTPAQLDEVAACGARFAVSPGATECLLQAAREHAVPLLPGAATASEVMRLLELGYRHMKFFPAEPAGGAALLRGSLRRCRQPVSARPAASRPSAQSVSRVAERRLRRRLLGGAGRSDQARRLVEDHGTGGRSCRSGCLRKQARARSRAPRLEQRKATIMTKHHIFHGRSPGMPWRTCSPAGAAPGSRS